MMKIQKLSNAQKTSASFLVIALGLLSLYLTLPENVSESELPTTMNVEKQSNFSQQVKEQVNNLSDVVANVKAKESIAVSAAEKTSANADHTSWQIADVKAATPSIPLNEQVAKYTIVQVEKNANDLPKIGQTIDIPMLDGETLRVNVESVSDNPNGDYTWSGHLQGHGTDYPVVMTYGENSIFASVTTPKGSYTMESVNGSGWLYKNPSEFELSKPGTKDFLEVDVHH